MNDVSNENVIILDKIYIEIYTKNDVNIEYMLYQRIIPQGNVSSILLALLIIFYYHIKPLFIRLSKLDGYMESFETAKYISFKPEEKHGGTLK